MPAVQITHEAEQAIRSKAIGEFAGTALRIDDKHCIIKLSWQTIKQLQSMKLHGETFSDTIIRLCAGEPN